MNDPKFKEGDWVKKKDGTKGMSVVRYVNGNDDSDFSGKVICKYSNEEGLDEEGEFSESDLVLL